MLDKKEQVKKIAELLKSIDMSGYDEKVHGDFEENVAEYLINNGVSVDPIETIKIKNLATLRDLIQDASIAYLDYLDDQDQRGLLDNEKRSACIAQYVADHSCEDRGVV